MMEQLLAKIDSRLDQAREEEQRLQARLDRAREQAERLQAARQALAGARPGQKTAVADGRRTGRRLTARQVQALALVEGRPGITAAELSKAMGGTYGYKIVKRLKDAGAIEPCEKGWQVR